MITSERGDRSQGTPRAARLLGALAIGAGFGAATAFMNALALGHADLESRAYTTSGWSYPEIISVLLDSGWAWAGCGVAVGWAVTRGGDGRRTAPALGAVAAALALLAATIAYGIGEAVADGGQTPWFGADELVWGTASIVLGAPLGAIGACARRPGAVGLLARLTVPVGAAVQMVVLPPGRNEVVQAIGKTIVWTGAAASITLIVAHFIVTQRRRRRPAAETP
nr:MAG: hypothetical protein DIU60_05510 [Actinomycetota bacterium]